MSFTEKVVAGLVISRYHKM